MPENEAIFVVDFTVVFSKKAGQAPFAFRRLAYIVGQQFRAPAARGSVFSKARAGAGDFVVAKAREANFALRLAAD